MCIRDRCNLSLGRHWKRPRDKQVTFLFVFKQLLIKTIMLTYCSVNSSADTTAEVIFSRKKNSLPYLWQSSQVIPDCIIIMNSKINNHNIQWNFNYTLCSGQLHFTFTLNFFMEQVKRVFSFNSVCLFLSLECVCLSIYLSTCLFGPCLMITLKISTNFCKLDMHV